MFFNIVADALCVGVSIDRESSDVDLLAEGREWVETSGLYPVPLGDGK